MGSNWLIVLEGRTRGIMSDQEKAGFIPLKLNNLLSPDGEFSRLQFVGVLFVTWAVIGFGLAFGVIIGSDLVVTLFELLVLVELWITLVSIMKRMRDADISFVLWLLASIFLPFTIPAFLVWLFVKPTSHRRTGLSQWTGD